eukprot:TRINITY_DN30298_c0_g1_i1.p1 TRINITY_DN30298_c0_g1~~TRINITY_DN30298_c0_g1_i1.p1  ORF type:complete len:689 (+),score=238.61 TRINITY_DN30298_c0_g1_i1:105-2069(+)
MAMAAKDLNTIDLDRLMETVAPNGGVKAQPPGAKKMAEVKDCLAADSQGNVGLPTYTTTVPTKARQGISMGGKHQDKKRYIGKGFSSLPLDTPGAVYEPKYGMDTTKGSSFGKAKRLAGPSTKKATPGPKYELTGTLGPQVTRSSSPVCKIPQARRFAEGGTVKEYISSAHSKSQGVTDPGQYPGPASYQVAVMLPGKGEVGYSFGAKGAGSNRFNDKVYISAAHAQSSGFGCEGPGPQPEMTKYTVYGASHDVVAKRPPHMKFAGGPFGTEVSKRGNMTVLGRDSPGPGIYDPAVTMVKERAPEYSFGLQGNAEKRFVSSALCSEAKGKESPGPTYYPAMEAVQAQSPGYSFASPDPTETATERFNEKQYIGAGLNAGTAGQSPGPAGYDAPSLPAGPAFTIAKKEKLLMKRICPAPEKPRFISKELAKENYGCFSPGPKYAFPGTIGQAGSVAHSFGLSDRQFSEQVAENTTFGTTEKPYTSPGEARFYSKQHNESMRGKTSPGPKYLPNESSVLHATLSTQTSPPAVSIGRKYRVRETDDSRSYHPSDRLIQPTSPGFGFGTASRYQSGPYNAGAEGGQGGGRKEQDRAKNIESSPGPGAFKPNYASVDHHVSACSIGGLSASYSVEGYTHVAGQAGKKRAKTTSSPPKKA